jgi:hypothetical protein
VNCFAAPEREAQGSGPIPTFLLDHRASALHVRNTCIDRHEAWPFLPALIMPSSSGLTVIGQ